MNRDHGQRRDCEHPRAHHQHGTLGAYRGDGCRCTDCTQANLAARRSKVRAQATGRWQPFTPAGPVREHLVRLRSAGVGVDQIANLSGVPGSTVRLVIYPRNGRHLEKINTETACLLLAAQPRPTSRATRSTIDASPTRARIEELLANGIGWAELAAALGRSSANLRRSFARPTVTVKTADEINCLHRNFISAATRTKRIS